LADLYFNFYRDSYLGAHKQCGDAEDLIHDYAASASAANWFSLFATYRVNLSIKKLDKEALGQRTSEADDLWGAGSCIEWVFRADPEAGKELVKNISKEALGQRISEADDLCEYRGQVFA